MPALCVCPCVCSNGRKFTKFTPRHLTETRARSSKLQGALPRGVLMRQGLYKPLSPKNRFTTALPSYNAALQLTTATPASCCSAAGQISGSGGGRTREPGHVCDHATAELIAVTGASPPSPPGPSAARLTWGVTSWPPREIWADAVEARAPEAVEARAPLRTLAPRASRTRSRGPACNRLLPTRSPWPPCAPRQAERSRRRVRRTPPRRGPPTCSRGPGPPRARLASPCSGAGSLHYQ